jgi:hypothetical protein
MSIIKYRTDHFADKIEKVEVLRETDACVYVPATGYRKSGSGERRESKLSDYAQYHDTWADAHAYLLQKAERVVKSARQQLEAANGKLGNIKGMRPPKDAQ